MKLKRIPESQGWIQRVGEWAVRQHTFMPRMIDLEVSRVCNLSCPACMRRAETSLSHKAEKYCTLDKFKAIHAQIPTLGTLNFMGDGEPLMNPELPDIIHYAAMNDIHTVLTTNGCLIEPKHIAQWQKDKVYHIHVSVDAMGKELYEKTRAGADWSKTLQNLYLVGRSGIPACINCVLTKQNIHQMPRMVELAHTVGFREITFLMPICAYGPDEAIRPDNGPENYSLFLQTQQMCMALGVKWIFPLTLNPTFRHFSFPFIRPEISVEGDLWACCYSLGRGKTWMMGEEIHIPEGTYNMGNMFKEGFKEVWYGNKYKELREVYKRTEVTRGTILTREEYVNRIRNVQSRVHKGLFDHCEICPARWGTACS